MSIFFVILRSKKLLKSVNVSRSYLETNTRTFFSDTRCIWQIMTETC